MEFDFVKAGLLFLLLLHYYHIRWGGEGEEGEQEKSEKIQEDFTADKVEPGESDSLSR